MIESWLRLEGTLKTIQFQPPAMGRVATHLAWMPRVPSKLVCSSLFQLYSHRFLQDYFNYALFSFSSATIHETGSTSEKRSPMKRERSHSHDSASSSLSSKASSKSLSLSLLSCIQDRKKTFCSACQRKKRRHKPLSFWQGLF